MARLKPIQLSTARKEAPVVTLIDPHQLSWQQRLKARLHKEKCDWQAMTLWQKLSLTLQLAIAVGMVVGMIFLLYHSVLADPSGSAGM